MTSVVPLRDATGETFGVLSISVDITDRKRTEWELEHAKKEAEQANNAKSQFLASMSHDSRTPLNGIYGTVRLLLDTTLDERQDKFMRACRTSAESLLTLINDILDFSTIEAGKLEIALHEFSAVDLVVDLVDGVVDVVGVCIRGKPVEFVQSMNPAANLDVIGDSGRLQQVLVNLLGNAIEFTERGEVALRIDVVHEQHDQVTLQFSIRDTGIGIPEGRLDNLFQSFTQLDASTRRKYGGTGLGLAINKNLVEAMAGQISVRSQEGVGSEFAFTVAFRKSGGKCRRSLELPARVHSLLAQVVEDNDANRHGLSEMLGAWEINTEAVANAHIALDRLRSATLSGQPFDLALVDQTLPDEDGATLAGLIQADERIRPPKVFLLTPLDARLCCEGKRAPGIDRCLSKPVSQSHLLDAISVCFCGLACERRGTADHHEAASDTSPPILDGTRVLLAEDQEINQFLAREILATQGIDRDVAANGREAVQAVLTRRYDVVLMDCQMPEIDGIEATQRIRELESAGQLMGHMPIVALTANAIRGDRERCLEAGMDDYVAKPFNPAELIMRVNAGRRIISLETRDLAIFAMAKLAESRDPETGDHLERVRSFCRILAEHLHTLPKFHESVDSDFVRLIYQTSPLHDIGKVAIPDRVLLTPDRLTHDEFEIMKTHAVHGAETLQAALEEYPHARFL